MTLRVNPTFATALNAAKTSNQAWSTAFKDGLGPTRRVICVRHASASTPDDQVFDLGTVFRNAALTGEMTISGGVVTNYGITSGQTVALAADLASGKSVLRITGNGNWIEGTLGLVGSGCDFILPANPTTSNSIAVSPNMRINPPPFLPSGTGPTPPTLDANAPAFIIIENWTNPAAVVEAGRIPLDRRIENQVFQHPRIAAEMGDMRVTLSSATVTHGQFEFGAVMWSLNPVVNSVANTPLHDVMIGWKPTDANWAGYPRSSGYLRGERMLAGALREYGLPTTFAPPFKAKICKADGTVLFTHEMRDGLPINSPQVGAVLTKTKALRPMMHCGSVLVWKSHKPKESTKARHFFPGVHASALRYSIQKEKASFNAPYVVYRPMQPQNSSGHWHAMPKWALPCSEEALTADQATRTDPYMYSLGPNNSAEFATWSTRDFMKTYFGVAEADAGSLTYGASAIQGWGYEPGSTGCHDQWTGPGGSRIDRSVIAGPLAIHMSDPNWVHLRDNTPIGEMVEHWNQNYFNQAWHYLTNVKEFSTLPVDEVLAGTWGCGDTYYNGASSFVPGGLEYTVPFLAVGASMGNTETLPHAGAFTDRDYRMPWNGAAIDSLHNYSMPGWATLLYNSPSHAFSQKMRFLVNCLLRNGPPGSMVGTYAIRSHAWQLAQLAMMWTLSSTGPLGISQDKMEARIVTELTKVYETITVPLNVQNSQTGYFKMLRNFGVPVKFYAGEWYTDSMGLTFYMAHTLQLWRQTGLWRKMYDHSNVTRDALLTIIQTLDVACFGFILETDGSYIGSGGSLFNGKPVFMANGTNTNESNPDVPTGWADWKARVWPQQGLENMIRNPAGALQRPPSDEQLRMQWPFIRRDYFPDIPCVYNVAAACTKVEGWQNEWSAMINGMETGGSSKRAISQAEWSLSPGYGRILPPTTLEP